MSFFSPENLWWAAALVPPLVLLYFLKIKRRPVRVSSILLWHKSLQDLRANAPFQRLRRNLLLFLQILALLLLVGALARPVARGTVFPGKYIVLLIDRSASMGARDEEGATRFEKAIEIARSIAADPESREIMVVSFASRAAVELPFTAASVEVRRALDGLACAEGGTNLGDALRIAHSAVRGKENARVVILSDGAAGALPDLPDRSYAVDLVAVGQRAENVGITALSARRPPEDRTGGIHLFAEIANASDRPWKVPVEVLHGGALADAAQVEVPAQSSAGRTFVLPGAGAGILTVRLGVSDDLRADDEASLRVLPAREPRLLLVTTGNVFLAGALKSIPGVSLTTAAPGEEKNFPAERPFDVAVYDAAPPPPSPPARAFLCFRVAPPGRDVRIEGEAESPLFGDGDWNDRHPVNRYADYSGLFVRKMARATLPPDATVLLESRAGPLAAAFEERGPRAVVVFFDLRESDWPFQVSFPVFLSNAVNWLCAGEESGTEGEWHRTDEPVPLGSGGTVRVRAPDGRTSELVPEGGRPPVFSSERTGIFEVETAEGSRFPLAVNLLSPPESDLRPRSSIELPGGSVEAAPAARAVHREYWPWFVLAAVLLLLVEWWVYHRRAV